MAILPPLSKNISVAGAKVAVLPPACKKIGVAGVNVAVLPPASKKIGATGRMWRFCPRHVRKSVSRG